LGVFFTDPKDLIRERHKHNEKQIRMNNASYSTPSKSKYKIPTRASISATTTRVDHWHTIKPDYLGNKYNRGEEYSKHQDNNSN